MQKEGRKNKKITLNRSMSMAYCNKTDRPPYGLRLFCFSNIGEREFFYVITQTELQSKKYNI